MKAIKGPVPLLLLKGHVCVKPDESNKGTGPSFTVKRPRICVEPNGSNKRKVLSVERLGWSA